jgi:hypothetical protein
MPIRMKRLAIRWSMPVKAFIEILPELILLIW